MRLPQTQPLDRLNKPQVKLFLKDISNFEELLEELTERYTARAATREALFGEPTAKTNVPWSDRPN
jgi:hypothetical protein